VGTQCYIHNAETVLIIHASDYTGSNPDIGRYDHGLDWLITAHLATIEMAAYDIDDPRGVGVINNKLYIADGDDHRTDDLLHAIHIFELP